MCYGMRAAAAAHLQCRRRLGVHGELARPGGAGGQQPLVGGQRLLQLALQVLPVLGDARALQPAHKTQGGLG